MLHINRSKYVFIWGGRLDQEVSAGEQCRITLVTQGLFYAQGGACQLCAEVPWGSTTNSGGLRNILKF